MKYDLSGNRGKTQFELYVIPLYNLKKISCSLNSCAIAVITYDPTCYGNNIGDWQR